MEIKKSTLYQLCLLTLVGFPLLAYLFLLFFDDAYFFEDIFKSNTSLFTQIIIGFFYGCTIGCLGIWIIKNKIGKPVRSILRQVLGNIKITWPDVFYFSLCAGVGEEIFFRGALQHFAGIWPTAIFFIFIHGYLSLTNWQKAIYGTFMVIIVAGMGYLDDFFGIWAAVTAHFIYDVFMFAYLTIYQNQIPNATQQNKHQQP